MIFSRKKDFISQGVLEIVELSNFKDEEDFWFFQELK